MSKKFGHSDSGLNPIEFENAMAAKLSLAIFMLFLLFNSMARADSLRCGTSLIEVGDTKAEVVEKCGRPTAVDKYCHNEYVQGRFGVEAICRSVDLWTYNFGVGRFLENVEFEEGRVSNITEGDRIN